MNEMAERIKRQIIFAGIVFVIVHPTSVQLKAKRSRHRRIHHHAEAAPAALQSQNGKGDLLVLDDVALLRDVDTVQELTDILVGDAALLLHLGGGLRHLVDVVTRQHQLILHVGRANSGHA